MFKYFLTMIVIVLMAFKAVPVCAEEQEKGSDVTGGEQPSITKSAELNLPKGESAAGQLSVMDMPVNFSTPEDVDKSIEKVRQEAGEAEALRLKNALGYILAYDLSLGRNKEKMYKKLNGRTPNAIIAKMKR